MLSYRTHVKRLLVVALAMSLASCTSSPTAPHEPTLPPAAEPAVAPALKVQPAGEVVPVGDLSEGIVADPVTHIVAVGVREPNALALLNGRTAEQIRSVPLPGQLRHLQLAGPGGPVLVPDEGANSLLRVALPSGEVISRVRTGVVPHDATAAANGSVFVANELGGSVVVAREGKVVRTFSDVIQPAGLAAVGNLVGLIDVRQNNLTRKYARLASSTCPAPHMQFQHHGRAGDPQRVRLRLREQLLIAAADRP